MYIESIELDNFKSFGEKVLIPFFPGFTTVSGPNGSGKSNVIDSLLFALGLSTNKTMRADRLTDLMNNLSGKSETQVAVTFYDDKSQSQVKVARKIRIKKNKQYESIYYLNNKVSTLGNIHEELSLYNVSPNAYNVVMQGDVTSIISMSPLERRKIIDELAGVAQFDRKITSARDEINIALDQLNSQTILLSEFSERLESLKNDRDTALKYRDLKTKRNNIEIILSHVRVQELEKQIVILQENIGKHAQEKTEYINKIEETQESIVILDSNIKINQEEIDKLNKEHRQELQNKVDDKKDKVNKIKASLEYLHKQINDYKDQIKYNKQEQENYKSKINTIQDRLNIIRKEKTELQRNLDAFNQEYNLIQERIKKESNNFNNHRLIELQQRQSELQTKQGEIKTDKAVQEEKYIQVKSNLEENRKLLEQEINKLQSVKSTSQDLLGADLTEKIKSSNYYIERLKEEKKHTELEIQEITEELYKTDKQLSKLEIKKQVSEDQNYGRAIDAVLNSNIQGIHDVLVKLGQVENKYSLALETAAGGRLRSLIIQDDYTGQQCIEFLRRNKLGRATFLPLNKFTRVPDYYNLPRGRGVIDWAFNLIQCDELYSPVFAYAFGQTLVVDNITNARDLMGQFRIVTLDGDILEKSGAMTGGSQKLTNNIGFGNKEAKEIQNLQEYLAKQEANLKSAKNSLKDIEQEIKESEVQLNSLRDKYNEYKTANEIELAKNKTLEENINKIKHSLQVNSQEKDSLEDSLKQYEILLKEITYEFTQVSNQLIQESSKMKNSGLEDLINKSQEIEYEKKSLEVKLNNLEYEKSSILGESDNNLQNIHKKNSEIKLAEDNIQKLNLQILHEEHEIKSYTIDLEKYIKQLSEIQNKIDTIQAKQTELNKQIIKYTEIRTQLSSKLESITEQITINKQKLIDREERLQELTALGATAEGQKQAQELLEQEMLAHNNSKLTEQDLKNILNKLEKKMQALEPVNMKAIEEFEHTFEKLQEIKAKCESLEKEREEIDKEINSYTHLKEKSFFEAFNSVNTHFQDIFAELSYGQGSLVLENEANPFEGGLIIQARPRNKKMQRLESMSGGEKSLTALSFLFALQWHNPAPFYAFDEVDMFLDGLNVERLSRMVQKQSQLAQFIVVSLRKPMLEKSDRAIGVCLGRNSFSQVSGIKLIQDSPEVSMRQTVSTHR